MKKKTEELKIYTYDPLMRRYKSDVELRLSNYRNKRAELLQGKRKLSNFANGHHYFGMHLEGKSVVFREWAPAAERVLVAGDFNGWDGSKAECARLENGVWEVRFPEEYRPEDGQKYKLHITYNGEFLERIPTYANYVVQDPSTHIWSAEVHLQGEEHPYKWQNQRIESSERPVIYECHIGMATEEYRVGTYAEFRDNVLPRIAADGYNTVQIMAIMEHPYYASFGYQVSNFFAASSRFGAPEDLKSLIDTAHGLGLRVLLDVVHSHAVANEWEGLARFDGTEYQFFHAGAEGNHSAWGTKLFDYGKNEVLHFLLSNLKFWMEEYHFDGFRFDGVTSMLYHDHGLGTAFDSYDKYFSMNTDTQAVTYLMLANEVIHETNPYALTIAEDMSGMPGMCLPQKEGGIGFDFRLNMGSPDLWIRLLTTRKDEDWSMWELWYELTGHRPHEGVIGYAESHDQALVGDKTIMFRLCDQEMYWHMQKSDRNNMVVNRGIALHKMIRLLVFSLAPNGYLNFMGNEFGHPEWIDFPREGNGWSHKYCRRQWSLVDNPDLRYGELGAFDKAMLKNGRAVRIFSDLAENLWVNEGDKVLIFKRADETYVFNFNTHNSFTGYFIPGDGTGSYELVFSTDDSEFGGYGRVSHDTDYQTETLPDGRTGFQAYLPARTASVFRKKEN
ncbi:MAG: alpha amylase C-terminal domain-containing protein [Lachnospiraceae bacterium]|nr:alpha amylase C-terminal domain-containing protein [Lachnospiraceae bacterium]